MEFQDRILRCVDCGKEFVWTAGEQQFFADKNFKNEPKRCKACKGKRASQIYRVAAEIMEKARVTIPYLVGTMIEVPRAALVADEIARSAQFFSFGTNDLTQTALGMSRDDSGSFLPTYAELDIVPTNPFASIDRKGVGRLMEITCDLGRKTRPDIKLGICGEHGGEPASVKFCHHLGLDYVSCSPFRLPIARLAAAQAALAK